MNKYPHGRRAKWIIRNLALNAHKFYRGYSYLIGYTNFWIRRVFLLYILLLLLLLLLLLSDIYICKIKI